GSICWGFDPRAKGPIDVSAGVGRDIGRDQRRPGQRGLKEEGAGIVAELPQKIDERRRQRQMEERNGAELERVFLIEHVSRETDQASAAREIGGPCELYQLREVMIQSGMTFASSHWRAISAS